MNIGTLIGSLRKESYNRKLFTALQELVSDDVTMSEVPIGELPLYNEDIENPFPSEVVRFKNALSESDAIIFISPEYNRSVPGVLKNAIDWSTRGTGGSVLDKKPGAIIGVTVGRLGTAPMQAHMTNIMLHVGMRVIAQPEVYITHAEEQFTENNLLAKEKTQKILQKFIDNFVSEVSVR